MRNGQGIHFHSTLALRPDGVPLGVLRQEPWMRDPEEYGKKHQRKQRPIEDKESYRWVTGKVAIELNIVAVIEEAPPEGIEPLKWFLLTTEPIETFQDVLEIVRLYKLRWHIEEYHLILKSGCRIEKVQFETAERIIKLLAILAAVACRILHLTYLARTNPDLPCTEVLTEHEWRALQTQIQGWPPPKETHPPSSKQTILWIGRLGGHIGRKSDGMPGVRSLWKGWRDLQLLTTMFVACSSGFNHLD